MIAEIDTTSSAQLLRSYEWGVDVSGTMTGAGGVGGLLIERFHTAPTLGTHAPCYDGNGNITELVNLANGNISARYEYGAFGETISMDGGAVAKANPFRFSTKYLDVEIGLYNYGYRYYDAVNGRWLNRDLIGEDGGINLYGMIGNGPVNRWDYLGLQVGYDPRRSIPQPGSGISPVNSQVNDSFAWHHTRHENVVTGCCCDSKEMQQMAREHFQTFDVFNQAGTGATVEISGDHAKFSPGGSGDQVLLALSLSTIAVRITKGQSWLYDLQAVTEEWHPLIGRRRWGSMPLMTRVGECSTIVIWTEAYEVANNLVSLGEKDAQDTASAMWIAYLNEVGRTIGVHCGGYTTGTKRVVNEPMLKGPMPWR